jgi:hypothetical protein
VLRDAGVAQVETSSKLTDWKLVAPDKPQDALPMRFGHELKSIHNQHFTQN